MSTINSKHTPGPWQVSKYDPYRVVVNEGGTCADQICTAQAIPRGADDSATDKARQADARLIAAAPDMLAALYDARSQLIALCGPGDVPDSVDAAIAAAEGKVHKTTEPDRRIGKEHRVQHYADQARIVELEGLLAEWANTELDQQDEEFEPWLESFELRVKAALAKD